MALDNSSRLEDDFLDNDMVMDQSSRSTSVPASVVMTTTAASSTTTITTIAIVCVAIILAIVAVFALGIFIDYRQEKINGQKLEEANKKRRRKRITLPMCRRTRDLESRNITDDAENPGRSRPPLETIVEVV